MGQFVVNEYSKSIDKLTSALVTRLDNPFYKFNDKPATIVTFYNVNIEESSLDEATANVYSQVNATSPLRFNKIENVMLYGVPRIQLDSLDQGEFGTESSPVEGEAYLPPNTFKPYPNSYFKIDYIDIGKTVLFKVNGVQLDTLPNGYNAYQLQYKMDLFDADIDAQVVKTFKMISGNIGTDLKSVVEDCEYDIVYRIQEQCDTLRKYYMDLFFKGNVQTFVYKYRADDGVYFYDPFIIEFLIRNKIMNGKEYEYISHQSYLPPSFNIDYDNTIFHAIEIKNTKLDMARAYATLIDDPMCLMSVRLEDYYSVAYTDVDGERITGVLGDPIDIIDSDLIYSIVNNVMLPDDDPRAYYNIIINYMNNGVLTEKIIDTMSNVKYVKCKELFYTIPIIIYCLEQYAYKLFKQSGKKS